MNQTNEVPASKLAMSVPSDRRRTDPRPVYESPVFIAGALAVLIGGYLVYRRYASGTSAASIGAEAPTSGGGFADGVGLMG